MNISRKRAPEAVGRGLGAGGPDKSNSLKIEGLSDICLSLFFRDDRNFNRYYTEYTIKKTTKNISLLIPLRKFIDITQLKNTKKKIIGRPMLNPPVQIPIQSVLYKTNTSLTGPATIFLVSQMKKNRIKQPLQNFTQRRKQT